MRLGFLRKWGTLFCYSSKETEVSIVKPGIHPKTFQIEVTCACGATYPTSSTKEQIKLDICSACHPFFTGKQKLIDTAGRVERFRSRYGNLKKNK